MQSVPKFVLKRLQDHSVASVGSHPDADLLTAFAEQSLKGNERVRVMEHLAACVDCRDVLDLAVPEDQIAALPQAAQAPRVGWLTWPAFRWAAVAAGVLIVASLGVLQYSHRQNQRTTASSTLPASSSTTPPSVQSVAPPNVVSQNLASQSTSPEAEIRGKHEAAANPANLSPAKPKSQTMGAAQSGQDEAMVRPLRKSFSPLDGSKANGANARIALNGPQASGNSVIRGASQAVEVQTNSGVVSMEASVAGHNESVQVESAQRELTRNQLAQNQAEFPLQGRNVASSDVVKAKDPVSSQSSPMASPVPASSMPLQTSPALMLRASPRWMVTLAGTLQRSFDGGSSWQTVDPSLKGATSAGSQEAQLSENKKVKDEAAPNPGSVPNSSPLFHAVAANGLEVWAGTSGGVLYHSSDGGNRWAESIPTDSVSALKGAITGIEFTDAQHGKVATSTGELWITSDAGLTWSRRP